MSDLKRAPKMVEVTCMPGDHVRHVNQRGVVQRLLREGDERPRIVALVYWDGGRKSFVPEKELTLSMETRWSVGGHQGAAYV